MYLKRQNLLFRMNYHILLQVNSACDVSLGVRSAQERESGHAETAQGQAW